MSGELKPKNLKKGILIKFISVKINAKHSNACKLCLALHYTNPEKLRAALKLKICLDFKNNPLSRETLPKSDF